MAKIDPDTYVRAAERLYFTQNVLSCVAISHAERQNEQTPYERSEAVKLYQEYFQPLPGEDKGFWGSGAPQQEFLDHRIMCLLMMFEIATDLKENNHAEN